MNFLSDKIFSISFLFSLIFFVSGYSYAQNISVEGTAVKEVKMEQDEKILRERLKGEGMSEEVINMLFKQRAELSASGRRLEWTLGKKLGGENPVPFATCGDMGAENGWAAWQGSPGTYPWNGNGALILNPPGVPTAPRFNLTSGAGIDPCTPGGGGPAVPVVAPGFGNASIQLGQPQFNGSAGGCSTPSTAGCAEQLIYPFTVTPQDTNFVYAYAIVIQNPGHSPGDQPYVSIGIYDANGDSIPCGYFKYVASSSLPGFYSSLCAGALYKPWTLVGINLSAYVGQTLSIVITNVDCAQGGHYAHSYWDFKCGAFTTNPASFCVGQSVTITAPSDPAIGYTYQWYQNGVAYTGAPSGTAQTITPFPQPGDTFAVQVQQPSGCDFYVTYVPTALSITANFTLANNCGTVTFTDASTSPSAGPITGWNWSFPGGTPATSTVQNPVVTYPPGTYTATLISTSQSGCLDTFQLPLTVGLPTAAFGTGPVCLGATTVFADSSIALSGDPITGWNWNFGDGSASGTSQNPTHVYSAPGTYSVTLVVTTQAGCTHTITNTVTVNPIPVPLFTSSPVCFNNPTVFTDQSTGATIWNWNFGDGNTSSQQSPQHTYGTAGTFSVTLIVTNAFGCKDTLPLTTVVNPLPVALFSSLPVCQGAQSCFTDASTVTPGTITGWSWNFGDPASGAANTSTLQNPCHSFTAAGQYTVILTATSDSGCQSTTMLPANVYPLPNAGITPQNVCLNALTNFTDASTSTAGNAINAWDWNFGDGSPNSNQQNPSHTYVTSGTFTITLIVTTVNGCKDTTTNTVTIYQAPVALFNDSVKGCAPTCATMQDLSTSADGTIVSWEWSFPGGTPPISSVQNPTICWNTPGVYNVQLIVTSSHGCVDTLFKPQYIEIYDWPVADFCVTPSLASISDPQFYFCDLWTGSVTSWVWDFGDGSPQDSVNTDPAHNYSASVTNNDFYVYTISLAVQNQYGCWDTISHTIEIMPEFTFYIPNTFTPNQDGMNEVFFGKGRGIKEYEIWLFDRWGNMLWNCDHSDKNTNWDGPGQDGLPAYCKWDGVVVSGGMDMGGNSKQFAQEDVYVWKVNLTDIFDKRHTYVGHVNIVR